VLDVEGKSVVFNLTLLGYENIYADIPYFIMV